MRRFNRYLGLLLAAALALVLPVNAASAEGPEAGTVTVQLYGHPAAYCSAPIPPDQTFSPIQTIEVPADATFGDIKADLPAPVETVGYRFTHYSKNNGGTGKLLWVDSDPIVLNGKVRSVYYAYQMRPAVEYVTNGADNAADPAFATYTSYEWSNAESIPIPAIDPVRANPEEGRSGDTFLGWYEDAENTTPLTAAMSPNQLVTKQGGKKVPVADPCPRDVYLAKVYAGWDEAPLLAVQDQTIVAGDAFDLNSLVASVTDKEDDAAGKPVAVTFSGDYDVDTPGTYPITVTATDSAGGTHTLTANLIVEAPAPVDVKLFGHPAAYCEAPLLEGETFHHFDTLTDFNVKSTFADVKTALPAPREVLGYQFSHYSKSNGGTGKLTWVDSDPIVLNGKARSVYYAYTMYPALEYVTNGADNAADPAFASYTATDGSNAEKVRIPAVDPVRANAEEGRSGDTFLGWYKDAETTKQLTAATSLRLLWIDQGSPYVKFTDPCPRDVKLAKAYAGWDEAPLLAVQDQTIVAGDAFDLNSLVASVTDKEDDAAGKPVAVTFSGDYDVDTPGTYPITVTATDSQGGTHTLTANLTVLMKAIELNEAPVLTLQDVTITAGDAFAVEDVLVSVSDKEDDAAGAAVTLTYAGDYDANVPGTYPITVTATDSQGAKTTKVAVLTVLAAPAPETPAPETPAPDPQKPTQPGLPAKPADPEPQLPRTGVTGGLLALLGAGLAIGGAGILGTRRKFS